MGIQREPKTMAKLKFVGKISPMGEKKIIYIPKEFHDQAEKLQGIQVRIVIDDEF